MRPSTTAFLAFLLAGCLGHGGTPVPPEANNAMQGLHETESFSALVRIGTGDQCQLDCASAQVIEIYEVPSYSTLTALKLDATFEQFEVFRTFTYEVTCDGSPGSHTECSSPLASGVATFPGPIQIDGLALGPSSRVYAKVEETTLAGGMTANHLVTDGQYNLKVAGLASVSRIWLPTEERRVDLEATVEAIPLFVGPQLVNPSATVPLADGGILRAGQLWVNWTSQGELDRRMTGHIHCGEPRACPSIWFEPSESPMLIAFEGLFEEELQLDIQPFLVDDNGGGPFPMKTPIRIEGWRLVFLGPAPTGPTNRTSDP